jgi:SAM-dependent MidA family methyltransferase
MEAMGPMPLARYMRMCLTSDSGGYYTRGDMPDGHDQFGLKGDFVTAPEISQVFGELVGLWFVMQWMRQSGKATDTIEIIEAGPGRGTLMADMLRVCLVYVFLVECEGWVSLTGLGGRYFTGST